MGKKPRDSFLLVSRKKGFHQCLNLCLSDCCNRYTLCGQPECQFHLNETEAQLLSLEGLCLSNVCQTRIFIMQRNMMCRYQ